METVSSTEGSWVITLPGEADEGALRRAGTGTLIEEDGVPLHLPVVPEPRKRPQPEVGVIEKSLEEEHRSVRVRIELN